MEIGNFNFEEAVIRAQQRKDAWKQLEKIGNTWVGPDVPVGETIVIPPQELVLHANLILNKKDLPPIELNRGAIGALDYSVRSFRAQSGIEIKFFSQEISDPMLKDLNDGKNISVPIDIYNHGQRAVELGGEVMRFFWVNEQKRLRGEDLKNAVKNEFVVEGKEGEDWFLAGVDLDEGLKVSKEGADKPVCVVVRLQDKRFYIPNDSEPLRIKNRTELSQVLKGIPPDLKLQFEIGQTPKVLIGENTVAVINLGAYDGGRRHIQSPLIDPGFKDHITGAGGHIRTETIHGMDAVEFFLYRK